MADSSTASSVTAVFDTPELLEHILLYLDSDEHKDWQTLICAQRVSRYFQTTIAGSKRLQKALYNVFRSDGELRMPQIFGFGISLSRGQSIPRLTLAPRVSLETMTWGYCYLLTAQTLSQCCSTPEQTWRRLVLASPNGTSTIRLELYGPLEDPDHRWQEFKLRAGETLGEFLDELIPRIDPALLQKAEC